MDKSSSSKLFLIDVCSSHSFNKSSEEGKLPTACLYLNDSLDS